MKTLLYLLTLTMCAGQALAGDGTDKNKKELVVGFKTNSIEGYGKFSIFQATGDTLFAVSQSSDVMPGLYIVTAASKNQYYHKKLVVLDPEVAVKEFGKAKEEVLAMFTGVVDAESYGKLQVGSMGNQYHFSTSTADSFSPGTYLIIGSSNHELYHQKLVITTQE